MKRSLNNPSSSSSSSISSSNSSSDLPIQSERSKSKRAKKNKISDESRNPNRPNSNRRSSVYRGVTRHRWTGRFEAHLWDKSSWNSIQNKKGKQVYLGAYDSEEAAARTYDLAALKYWGPDTILNFPLETYAKDVEEMQKVSKEEYLASLRRQSSGFSRGVSKYRGVARHHHNGRWEARIGRVFGNKYLYLGTYNTQEEAAAAYDMAAIEYRGANAVTNFDISNYIERLKKKGVFPFPLNQTQEPILESSTEQQRQQIEEQEEQKQCSEEPRRTEEEKREQGKEDRNADTMIVEPSDNNELAWSFCMDSGFHPFFNDREFPIEKSMELPDLLDEIGFEDNIDFMFDEMNVDNARCCIVDEIGGGGGGGCGGRETSSSPGDSPSSSITSVSCNYSV